MNTGDLFEALLKCENDNQVISVLKSYDLLEFNDIHWKPLGGIFNNEGFLSGQNPSPAGALVEKITNSVDSILIKECKLNNIDPESSNAPQTQKEATEKFFNLDKGEISYLYNPNHTDEYLTELADNIQIFATGAARNNYPSITIADRGEGQSENTIEDTFLSLAKDNKGGINFTQGKFNQGGAGTLRFSGEYGFNLIATKKHPNLNESPYWCFTLLRTF